MFRLLKFSLLSAFFVCIFVVASGYFLTQKSLHQILHVPVEGMVLNVEPGSNLSRLSAELEQKNVIFGRRLLLLYARFKPLDNIHAGEYQVLYGESFEQLLEKLTQGKVIYYQITFPEGLNQFQWQQIIEQHPQLTKESELPVAQQMELFKAVHSLVNMEGWLLPETYRFSGGDTVVDILSRAYQQMRKILDEEWQERDEGLPYNSPYEALIMASIVEKETGVAVEREQISGVFVRRMQKNMRLQTDPTVIYGLGERYNGNLTRRDLKRKTAYNTYAIKGLPPTPIAMPGRAAIRAALHPDTGNALYFVAKGDGTHQFSATLKEHTKAVRQYQLNRRSNYRSSPGK